MCQLLYTYEAMKNTLSLILTNLVITLFQWRTEQDMQSRCWICERNGYEFEQKAIVCQYSHRYYVYAKIAEV